MKRSIRHGGCYVLILQLLAVVLVVGYLYFKNVAKSEVKVPTPIGAIQKIVPAETKDPG